MLKRLFDPAAMYAHRLETSLNEARMGAFEHENAAECVFHAMADTIPC